MVQLSVNVNKIATLRNARGSNLPDVVQVVKDLVQFGAKSITVHPRPDRRHILYEDVHQIQQALALFPDVELNVEGYPAISFIQLIEEVQPTQCTLVPDSPAVITSNAGWQLYKNRELLKKIILCLKTHHVRSSLFVDPFTMEEREWSVLKQLQPDRVELYTQAYAESYPSPQKREQVIAVYRRVAQQLSQIGISINAGHDLNQENLSYFLQEVSDIREVSIGHALICEALYQGLEAVVHQYLKICGSCR